MTKLEWHELNNGDFVIREENESTDTDTGFYIGTVVTLVTGSPDMVVVDTCECGTVDVVWYDDYGFNEASLPKEALVHAVILAAVLSALALRV